MPTGKPMSRPRSRAALGRELFALTLADLPASANEQEALATLWQREAVLLPAALLIEAGDRYDAGAARRASSSRLRGLTFVVQRATAPPLHDTQARARR